jgi:hypothetical protein
MNFVEIAAIMMSLLGAGNPASIRWRAYRRVMFRLYFDQSAFLFRVCFHWLTRNGIWDPLPGRISDNGAGWLSLLCSDWFRMRCHNAKIETGLQQIGSRRGMKWIQPADNLAITKTADGRHEHHMEDVAVAFGGRHLRRIGGRRRARQ